MIEAFNWTMLLSPSSLQYGYQQHRNRQPHHETNQVTRWQHSEGVRRIILKRNLADRGMICSASQSFKKHNLGDVADVGWLFFRVDSLQSLVEAAQTREVITQESQSFVIIIDECMRICCAISICQRMRKVSSLFPQCF